MVGRLSRYGVAIALGSGITFGLLFLMQYMISVGRDHADEAERYRIVDFIRVEREQVVEEKKQKPEKPPEPEQMPEMPEPVVSTKQTTLQVAMVAPPVTMNSGIGSLGFGSSDGEYLPVFKVLPLYPQRAAARGLEGKVTVQFTVMGDGSTRDVVVIESTSPLFDRAAIESAKKYKYKPRIVDGVPVAVEGVTTDIIFRLDG